KPSETEVSQNLGNAFISLEEVLERYQNEDVVLWDARSRDEFEGIRSYTPKAGHIPGAIHYEWTQPMDMNLQLRLRDLGVLREELASMGITSDKEVITYCHSHHRSAFAWLVSKVLGFPNVRGFAGSSVQFGTRLDTPANKEFSYISLSVLDRLYVWMQYVLARHTLSRLVGGLAGSEKPWIKNPLIKRFSQRIGISLHEAKIQDPTV